MKNVRNIIVAYLFGSSIYGCFNIADFFLAIRDYPQYWWVGVTFLILFLGLGISGYLLLKTKQYSWATIALQVIQLVGFSLAGYKYQFSAGASLKLGYEDNNLLFVLKPLTAEFTVGMNLKDEFLYVNLVPLVMIVLITHYFSQKNDSVIV